MLRLSVREITSVSATFILSSSLDSDSDIPSLIAHALSKGLSVTVNGSAWPRTFIRIDEHVDEAVIIIYALMPARHYDIDLGLPSQGLTSQIVTQENDDPDSPTLDDDDSTSSSSSSSLSSPSSFTPPSSSSFITPPPSQLPPSTPPPQLPLTLTERLAQLHQSLSHLTTERDTLLTSLKSLRRESQKADASLRAEIDTLKRTFEKNASFELRTRQKLLALQESIKRAQNAARDTEEMTREVEREILELTKKKQDNENEHSRMEDEAAKMKTERGEVEDKERKKVDGMRGELNGLTNKLERLNGKRERMESTVIPDLEAKVQDIECEIEHAEREVVKLEKEDQIRLPFEETYLPYHHLQQPGPLWGSTTRPIRGHNPKSHSIHSTHPRPALKTTTKSTSMSTTMSQPSSLFLTDQPQHTSPVIPSSRSSPGTSGNIRTAYSPGTSNAASDVPDPLPVGAGRPSRRSFETTPNRSLLG